MTIEENVALIRKSIDEINKNCQIVAATKTRDRATVTKCMATRMVLAAGENRVQELVEKYTDEYRWDFIGRLQTNKVKYIIDKVELIHSLDRADLCAAIQKECVKKNKAKQKTLIEINTGLEENKGGIRLDNLDEFLDEVSKFDRIEVDGLMAVAPLWYDEDALKKTFDEVYEEFFKRKNDTFNELSMGMSGDYLIAAKCGATIVRPGRAIFGERSYV